MTDQTARSRGSPLELPEIANQEVLGEWLIPNGDCLLVSFGPHTVADKDGKAVVRERLAFVEAEEQTGVIAGSAAPIPLHPHAAFRDCTTGAFGADAPPAVPPGSHVPYPPNGHASPGHRSRLRSAGGFSPTPISPSMIRGVPPPAPQVPATDGPRRQAADARCPSRSFPEGVHTDGSKAKLPPLPDDEMDDDSADSESAEPLPSPQTKKPRKTKPSQRRRQHDQGRLHQPKSSTVFLPSVFLPGASVGFQFLLPIRPLSFRLPFNQRLEIEIFGRVHTVPDNRQ